MPDRTRAYASPRAAFRGGMRDVLGAPLLVLGASYLGFGSLVRASGLGLPVGLLSTLTGWALPGQMVLIEAYAVGASLLAMVAAVALVNVRLLPMTLVLLPGLRVPGRPRWWDYAAAHLVAVTGWVQGMRVCPTLPPEQRLPYFVGFAGILWASCVAWTVVGFYLVTAVPAAVSLGLVFLNPLYFILVLTADLRNRARLGAMVLARRWGRRCTGSIRNGGCWPPG
ncbi:AzlC family ABC transporter permease [Mycobacterium sp. KBS0706]|uniref:AzlC family ABC transporter permease n=1 Tax=Mycobacterium sp. KBS0706 TaxID=2578109 RepID=UPI00163D9834|nr:AzlC family ABC transporter permease [Mycobacterium sp. KBS0706]